MSEHQPILVKVTSGQQIAIRPVMVLGRSVESDLQLTEGHASRKHAKLTIEDDGVWLEDLGAANGTFVNGARITARVRLNSGDRLRFDVEEFDFRGPGAPAVADEGKTMFRPPESAAVVAESSGVYKRPGAWADPDAMGDGANKTKFIDPAQLKQMMDSAPTPEAASLTSIDSPHLHVASGSRAGLNIKLAVGDTGTKEWTIGNSPERAVQLQDSGVSALHAKIVNEGVRWKVIDQMSANGTFVNGKRSTVSYLTAGDRVRFGPVECVFRAPQSMTAGASRGGGVEGAGKNKTLAIGVAAFVVTILVLFLVYKFVL